MMRIPPVRPTRWTEYKFIAVVDYDEGIGGMSGSCKDNTHARCSFCWAENLFA